MIKKVFASMFLGAALTAGLTCSAFAADSINFWFPTFAAADGEVTDEEFWSDNVIEF